MGQKLTVQSLVVESFDTGIELGRRGTVAARSIMTFGFECGTEGGTMQGQGWTCELTCSVQVFPQCENTTQYTKPETCHHTCSTCPD